MKRTNKHNTHKKIYISLISISLFMMSFLYLFYFKDNFSVFNDQNKPEKKITDYTINVHFLEKEKKLYGKESINFFNNYNKPLNKLVFHLYAKGFNNKDTAPSIDQDFENSSTDSLGNIKIKSVHIDNKSINFTTNNQILKISLTPLLKPKKNLKIDIDFELTIPNGRDRLGYFNDQYSITNWYPILSIFDEKTGTWDENSFYKIGESNHSSISNYCINLTVPRSEEHTSELQSRQYLVCRLLLEKKKYVYRVHRRPYVSADAHTLDIREIVLGTGMRDLQVDRDIVRLADKQHPQLVQRVCVVARL